ncbi:MAG: hypothetical protein J6T45_04170 [Fibrobacterales bacterium]|nr:hypothetical protein [Fibrobacterales bacterium]
MKHALISGSLGLLAGAGLLVACGESGGSSPTPVQGGIDSCVGEYAGQIPADFSASGYAAANPDLAAAICIDGACDGADECRDLVRHWVNYGQGEGRTYDAPVVPSSETGSSEGGSSEGGNSAGTPSSSSIKAFSSAAPGTLPAEFRAEEYCFLNTDVAGVLGVSNCTGLTDGQRGQLENHYLSSGASEGRWWNVEVQCSQRALYEAQLPCSADSIAALRKCTDAECQSKLSACMAGVHELAASELPCDFGKVNYFRACQNAQSKLCLASTYTETDYLAASWFLEGRENGWAYTNVPADFSASGYCDLNPSVKAIYGPTCDQQTAAWHYVLFGKSQNLQYKSQEIVDPFADYTPITTEPSFKIVGYVQSGTNGGWNADYYKKATHLVIFGPEVDANGNIVWIGTSKDDLKYWAYQGSKTDTRIMVAIGGADGTARGGRNKSANFSAIANAGAAQTNFLNQLAELKDYWVWGVDIDREDVWPYGAGLDQLVPAIYNKIHPLGMKVTVATGSQNNGLGAWGSVDWVNVMCYDFNGNASSCPGTCMNSSSYPTHKSQTAIGVPFYTGAGSYLSGATNDLVSLSGIATATSNIKNNGFAGIMIWDLSQDKTDASNSLLYKIAATAGYNP